MNISDVARMAGVSRAAVSRYFNKGYISEEKREAIRQVVEETGFRPSVQAKNLRMKKTNLVGVIIPRIDSYSMTAVVSGIQERLESAGYHIMLSITNNDPDTELEHLGLWKARQVNGVILAATVFTERHYRVFQEQKLPLVIVGQKLDGYSCVYHDDYHAIYDMTTRMLRKGRKRLAYMGVLLEDHAVGTERRRAYCDAVRDAGLPELANRTMITDFTVEAARRRMADLWARYPDMDGVVCATDRIAVGCMQYLQEAGVKIPEQVMISGCGDSELSRVTRPSLSTVRLVYHESGECAAGLLLDIMEEHASEDREILLGYSIAERESTK